MVRAAILNRVIKEELTKRGHESNTKTRECCRYLRSAFLAKESDLQRPERMTCVIILRNHGGWRRGEGEVVGRKGKEGGRNTATGYWLLLVARWGATKGTLGGALK